MRSRPPPLNAPCRTRLSADGMAGLRMESAVVHRQRRAWIGLQRTRGYGASTGVRDAAVHGPVPYSRCRTTGERAVEPPRNLEVGTLDCSEVSIADPGVEAEVGTKLCARTSRECFGNRAPRVVSGRRRRGRDASGGGARFDAGRVASVPRVDAMHAEVAGLDGPLASRATRASGSQPPRARTRAPGRGTPSRSSGSRCRCACPPARCRPRA